MNNKNNCVHFDECSAPLCPFETDQQYKSCIWYPDEEICRRIKGIPNWIRQQRKVAKKAKPENHRFYYTLDMLKVPFRVTEAVKGIDPDKPNQKWKLKVWHKRYKGTKPRQLTDEQREQRRKSLESARRKKQEGIEARKKNQEVDKDNNNELPN